MASTLAHHRDRTPLYYTMDSKGLPRGPEWERIARAQIAKREREHDKRRGDTAAKMHAAVKAEVDVQLACIQKHLWKGQAVFSCPTRHTHVDIVNVLAPETERCTLIPISKIVLEVKNDKVLKMSDFTMQHKHLVAPRAVQWTFAFTSSLPRH